MSDIDYGRIISKPFIKTGKIIGDIATQPGPFTLLSLLFVILVFRFLSALFGGGTRKRRSLTSAKWAGLWPKIALTFLAQKQLVSRDINDVVLWCGTPERWKRQGFMPLVLTLLFKQPPTVYVTNANQSIAVIGRPNSGKTFSAIDPLVKSAIDQKMAIALYDFKADDLGKGGQLDYLGTLAYRKRYDLNIFSPGREYSCIINVCDFIEDANDDITARVLAEVFHVNLKQDVGKGDAFFGPAGQQLIQGLILFAKSTCFPDLVMAFCVLVLDDLPSRLAFAAKQGTLPPFVEIAFSQLISAAESEKTTASIISTAAITLTRFISPRIIPWIIGKTSISPILGKNQMLIFHSDRFRETVMNPLLASIINIVMLKNFSIRRKGPIVFCADELPTILLPTCPDWANRFRSEGFAGIYGFQSHVQLVDKYGKEQAKTLMNGLGTEFWFNPNDKDTAKSWQEILGEEEVWVKTESRSRSKGDEWGRSRSTNEQLHKRPLMSSDAILRFDQGECILRNPGLKEAKRKTQNQQAGKTKDAGMPWHIPSIKIPERDQALAKECRELWDNKLRQKLTERAMLGKTPVDVEHELKIRQQEADRLLPLPPSKKQKSEFEKIGI